MTTYSVVCYKKDGSTLNLQNILHRRPYIFYSTPAIQQHKIYLMTTTLYYVHDPMCSWCWAFRPVYDAIINDLPGDISLSRLLGGLAPDTDEPMSDEMQTYVKNHWRTIQNKVPGIEFNYDFWKKCNPRRTTYPACRAVIAARNQGNVYDDQMTLAIQHAYYLQARNPSEYDTLIALANEIELDTTQFAGDLVSTTTDDILKQEIEFTCQLEVRGLPTMMIGFNGQYYHIPIDYLNAENMLKIIQEKILTSK